MISDAEVIHAYVMLAHPHPSELRPVGYYLREAGYTDPLIHTHLASMEMRKIIIRREGLGGLKPWIEIRQDHIPSVDRQQHNRYT